MSAFSIFVHHRGWIAKCYDGKLEKREKNNRDPNIERSQRYKPLSLCRWYPSHRRGILHYRKMIQKSPRWISSSFRRNLKQLKMQNILLEHPIKNNATYLSNLGNTFTNKLEPLHLSWIVLSKGSGKIRSLEQGSRESEGKNLELGSDVAQPGRKSETN